MTAPAGARLARALEALGARAVFGMRLGLGAVDAALDAAGRPDAGLRVVHVAGTNGKGSTSALVEAAARASGLRTGLYTSPHLVRFAERVRVDGVPLADGPLADALERALALDPELTFFEVATVAALIAFREAGVDLVVLEVGLGGRLDATRAARDVCVTVITSIGLDHEDRLGRGLAAIAAEKAAIARPGVPLVLARLPREADRVVRDVARAVGAPVLDVPVAAPGGPEAAGGALGGGYQAVNAATARAVCGVLGLPDAAIARGFADARWPGRLERVDAADGPYLLDGAHNPDGARALGASLAGRAPRALVLGALADKAWPAVLDVLAAHVPAARRVYVAPQGRAPAPPERLAARHPGELAADVPRALARARALAGDGLVLVTGSLYLVGEARGVLGDGPGELRVGL